MNQREAASWLLRSDLWPLRLIAGGVRRLHGGSIHQEHPATALSARPTPENSGVTHQGRIRYILSSRMMTRFVFRFSVILALFAPASSGAADARGIDEVVRPFLQKHCVECHDAEVQKGEFRVDNLSPKVGTENTPQWLEVMERINTGEMPPKKVKVRPSVDESAEVVEWIAARMKEGESARMAARGRVSYNRLTRDEYVNTVRDLIGVHFDANDPDNLLEDPEWHGFERIGSVLTLSPSNIEKYLGAAETILDEAYPDPLPENAKPVPPFGGSKPAIVEEQINERHRDRLRELGLLDKVRFEMWPGDMFRYSNLREPLPGPGIYEISYTLSGLKSANGRAPRLKVYEARLDRVLFEQDIVAPEDRPITVTFRAHLPKETFRNAVKAGMLAILNSKSFLFIAEGDENTSRHTLNDWEIASRLSYLLWNTMPDAELFALAEQGKLRDKAVLAQQVTRLLVDARSLRFTDSFATQWLCLKKVGMFPPDKKLYPDYDHALETSMVGETKAFFREVLSSGLTLREFLHSDWSMMNPRLAQFYGLPEEMLGGADEFQRVSLPAASHRGGLLTQASILSLTSDGVRHRPVHRGVWVMESIFGKSPPPPPANVDPIPTNPTRPKATLRQKLEAHINDPNCTACHAKIDPLGLAFENYDAIGRWRTEEFTDGIGENPKVTAAGMLPDGREYLNVDEFKKLREASAEAMKDVESSLNATVQEANVNLSDQAEPKTDDYASSILESAPDVTKVYRDALRQGRDSWGVKRTARPLWFKHSAGIRTRVQSGAARVKRFKRPALHK